MCHASFHHSLTNTFTPQPTSNSENKALLFLHSCRVNSTIQLFLLWWQRCIIPSQNHTGNRQSEQSTRKQAISLSDPLMLHVRDKHIMCHSYTSGILTNTRSKRTCWNGGRPCLETGWVQKAHVAHPNQIPNLHSSVYCQRYSHSTEVA